MSPPHTPPRGVPIPTCLTRNDTVETQLEAIGIRFQATGVATQLSRPLPVSLEARLVSRLMWRLLLVYGGTYDGRDLTPETSIRWGRHAFRRCGRFPCPWPSRTLASTVAMRRVRWTTSAEQVILPSLTAPRKWTSRPIVAVLRPTSAATESPIALSMSEA